MFRKHSRIIAAIALGFFTWTSGGVFSIAHAAQTAVKKEKAREQHKKKSEAPEERFAKIAEELETTIDDSKADINTKKKRIKASKTEIDALDPDIRKQFDETEKKLKDAGLPAEILERHHKFVKHYDDNLAELKGNIERIEKAKTKVEAEVEFENIHKHLKRVKAPSRHQKLDPNNLPHRQPKMKKREPRMKKEEFERDIKKNKHAWKKEKRIMVASTGSLFGLLNSSVVNAINPTADDLAETIEVQLTPEIKAKALELGNNPVRIYEWVRNNIEFVPTWGSIQGAQMTMLTKQGNAFDTASLLIALLRAAGIHARYATGTIEVPIEKVMNWAGGFTDPKAALDFIASGGVPVIGVKSGGTLISARMEHVWVRAWIDMVPSLGAIHKQGDTWVPLDSSFKKYTYADGVDFKTVVPFDGQSFNDQLKAASTINEQESYVTNVNSALVGTALSDYNSRLQNYVSQNLPNATAADVLGKKEILKKEQAILPASLPYKVVVAGTETAEISSILRHKIDIQLVDANSFDTAFTYSASLPQLTGKRITVSYEPATPADKAIIDSYAAQYATSIPAYLIQLKPVLRIDNTIIATGPTAGMGAAQNLSISMTSPRNTEIVTHKLVAGDYTAIGLNPSKIGLELFQNRVNKNDFSEPVGEMLHQTALSYWAEADAFNDVIAKTLRVRNLRHTSELAATAKISVFSVFGIPTAATYKSRNLDVKLDNQSVMGMSVDKTKESAYMQQSGTNSSFLEGAIFDQLFGKNIGDSISAVSAMKLANDQGIPIYRVDANNVSTVLPKLQVANEIKTEVTNAVNAGLVVQIPKNNITQLGWTGVGYIISNPVDGTGAYRISGGLNGGDSGTGVNTVIPTPQVPVTGPMAFVISGIASSAGIGFEVNGSVITGIAIAPELIATGAYLAFMGVILLIWAALKSIADKFNPPPRWEPYRHYTNVYSIPLILGTNMLRVGELEGTYGYGLYLTRISIKPDSTINSSGQISYGPNCWEILAALELSSIEKTGAYIDFLIDTSKRAVLPKKPPQEYLLIGWPGEMIPLGVYIKVTGSWMPTP